MDAKVIEFETGKPRETPERCLQKAMMEDSDEVVVLLWKKEKGYMVLYTTLESRMTTIGALEEIKYQLQR